MSSEAGWIGIVGHSASTSFLLKLWIDIVKYKGLSESGYPELKDAQDKKHYTIGSIYYVPG
jgi:hypothetical protein